MPKIPSEADKRISTSFQQRIVSLIQDSDCKKSEFAKLVGVSGSVINNAATYGIIPSLRLLIKLADYAGVSIRYILGETDCKDFDKSDNPSDFHTRIEELVAEKGTTYCKLANKMPFGKTFFYEWQNKKTLPSLIYLEALADYFKVSLDYLAGRTDDRNPL